MEIRLRADGAVMTEQEFRRLHPNTSLPRPLTEAAINEFGGDVVFEGPQATGDRYQFSQRQGVEQINGKWYTKYVLGPVFTDYTDDENVVHTAAEQEAAYKAQKDEAQANSIRSDRNKRLSDSDWTQGKDIPDAVSVPWAAYRQELRDVPDQDGFPWEVIWPTEPT